MCFHIPFRFGTEVAGNVLKEYGLVSPFITFQEEDQHSMSGNNHYGALRNRLLVSMILVPLIPFVLVLAIGYYYFTTSLENGTLSSMRRIVEDHRQMIDSFLKERKADLSFALQSYTSGELSNTRILEGVFSRLRSASLASPNLAIVCNKRASN